MKQCSRCKIKLRSISNGVKFTQYTKYNKFIAEYCFCEKCAGLLKEFIADFTKIPQETKFNPPEYDTGRGGTDEII